MLSPSEEHGSSPETSDHQGSEAAVARQEAAVARQDSISQGLISVSRCELFLAVLRLHDVLEPIENRNLFKDS